MTDPSRTYPELIEEISALKQRIKELEQSEPDRKPAEQAEGVIRDRERLFTLTLDDMITFVAILKPDGEIIFVNNTPLKLIGKSIEQVRGMKFYDMDWWAYSNDIQQLIKEDLERCASGEKIFREVQIRTLDRYMWIDFSIHPIFGEDGNMLYLIPEGRDTTERKQAEEFLRQSEEKYRSIFENSVEGIFQTSPEGQYISVNPALARMIGYDLPEELMKGVADLSKQGYVNPEDRVRYKKVLEEQGIIQGFETQHYKKDGSMIWVSINARAVKDEAGKIRYYEGTIEDITSHKQAEEQLKYEGQRFSVLSENAAFGMALINEDGNFVYINPKFKEIFGYDLSEIPDGRTWFTRAYPDPAYRHTVIAAWVEDLKGAGPGEKRPRVFTVTCKDGTEKIINLIPVQMETGVHIMTCEDITSRKVAEEELQQTTEKLRKSLSGTIQALSSTVETRDPYTAGHQRKVSNLARTIAQEMGLSNDTVENIRMAGIIHDIGKISIPAEILSKPTKLTATEFSLIKAHSQTAYDILKDVGLPYPIAEIVLQHHERLDGSGYPQGLKNGETLLEAKIISVADVVDAIASHRPYRPGFGIDVALEEIEKNAGVLYDREAVEACLKLFREKGFKFE